MSKKTTTPKTAAASKKAAAIETKPVEVLETSVAVMEEMEPVTVLEATPSVGFAIPAEPAAEKAEEKKAVGKVMGARDEFGFGASTITSAIIAAIASGEFTKKELKEAILDSFAGSDAAKRKAVEATISVTLCDIRRPIGKYHASRSLVVLEDPDGKLSLDQDRTTLVKSAISSGILSAIRGKSGSKRNEVISSFGLPTE